METINNKANFDINTKTVLTTAEAAKYMGVSKGYLYKLTMQRKIPYSKPMGKLCYFDKKALDDFLKSNQIKTQQQLDEAASKYNTKKKWEDKV